MTNRTLKKRRTKKNVRGRPPKDWRPKFLVALAERAVVAFACKKAGVSRTTAYLARDLEGKVGVQLSLAQAFAADWEAAVEDAADRLEQEAFRRGHNGVLAPRTIAGEKLYVREYSDTLLIFLLKGMRPYKFRDNIHHSGAIGSRPLVLADADPRSPDQDPDRDPDVIAVLEGASRPQRQQDGKNGSG